jgi:hypothetical protein
MKDYLYYLFDEKLSGDDLSAVKEQICATGAKVIDLQPSKKNIQKRLKELKGPKKYALLIGNTIEAQQAAKEAKVQFCGWLDGTAPEDAFKQLPYRQLLSDIKLLPLVSQPYSFHNFGWIGKFVKKNARWVHFKQIKGISHKPKHSSKIQECKNCGETYEGRYCPTCGQKHDVKRYELAGIFKDIVTDAIDLEHGFLRTFLELFWRPGYMMRDYLNGQRKDYSKPFKVIFVLATIYLVAAHLLDPTSFVKQKEEPDIEQIPDIVQKMAADSTNNEVVPQLYEINKLAREVINIRREQKTARSMEMADSIIKQNRGRGFLMSKEDSIMIMHQVMAGINKADSVKLSEALRESLKDSNSRWARFAMIAARNAEAVEKFEERYYHEGTLLYSMVDLLKSFFSMNKAVTILLLIPVLVFCARRSFRTTLVGMRTNLAEYILIFTIFGVQQMWIQLFALLITQKSNFMFTYDMGASMLFFMWDMKQFFNLDWKGTLKRTLIYMNGHALLIAILTPFFISILGSAVMWVIVQITR